MVPGVYILLSPQEKRCTLLPRGTDVHIQEQHGVKVAPRPRNPGPRDTWTWDPGPPKV